jgi:dipeptidyl aminopeptidase/acylaminoacyl peptidase
MRLLLPPLLIGSVTAAVAQTQGRFTPEMALNVASYTVQDISDDGGWIAVTSSSRGDLVGVDYRRDGDPSYLRPSLARLWVINSGTGASRSVFPDARNIKRAAWSPDGKQLAILVAQGNELVPMIWDRETNRTAALKLPADRYVAENSELRWNRAGSRVLLAARSRSWKAATERRFREMTAGPVFVQSSSDPFLAWDELRRRGAIRSIVSVDPRSGRIEELLPETVVPRWRLAEDDSSLIYDEDITPKTDYDAILFATENSLIAPAGLTKTVLKVGGRSRTLLATSKGISAMTVSRNGRDLAYLQDGKLFVLTPADTAPRQIAGPSGATPAPGDTSKAARERRARERMTPVRWSGDGAELIVSNVEGLWFANPQTGERSPLLATDTVSGPRYQVIGWSEDRQTVHFSFASRRAWERGLASYDRTTRRLVETVKDSRSYGGARFSRDGRVAVLTVADGARPPDLYLATGGLTRLARLVEANPGLASVDFGKTELIEYLDVDGRRQFGVVYYPTGYRAGRPYPTVFYVYESFFDDRYESIIATLTASGYVVVQPSVSFETGFPGEGWLKGVTAAANHLIEKGVADSARLGLQGISYGGYATNLLITQTKRFKAAINISGKVDIISFYTDSPRLGVRNVHAAEKSQDRIGATLWQQPQKYVEHSAVMFADRITTPLLLLTGELDSNVPAGNTREMFYALRRLGKEVTWVNYLNGGHGTPMGRAEDFLDFHRRIVSWYDTFLKPTPLN